MKTYPFIVNTENVNNYGFRILTLGIDYTQFMKNPVVMYMHNRGENEPEGNEVIGRVVKLYIEGTDLKCDIEFDEADEFANKIAGKVERGFLRMCSPSVKPLEWSDESNLILEGQKLATITKSKLVEISIVDIGGNDDALKLYDGKNQDFQLEQLKLSNTKKMNKELIQLALFLGLNQESGITEITQNIQNLKLERDDFKQKFTDLEAKLKSQNSAVALSLTTKAIELKLIPEAFKDSTIKLFDADFDAQKTVLEGMITTAESQKINTDANKKLSGFVEGLGSGKTPTTEKSFDELQKTNPAELKRLKSEEPEKYAKLSLEYSKGVRFVAP